MVVAAGLTCAQLASVTGAEPGEQAQLVTLNANPEPIAIDLSKTAVMVVDMENDFAAKGGMFDRAGIDISGAQKAIQPTAQALAAARAAGIKVVYLKMGYQPDLSDLGASDSVNRTRHVKLGVGSDNSRA